MTAVLGRQLHLPMSAARERVFVRDRQYDLRESDVRALAVVGAFRVVPANDLHEVSGTTGRTLRHLSEQGLVDIGPPQLCDGVRSSTVTLTRGGQRLLEAHQAPRQGDPRQVYYAGLVKPRETFHDAQLFRAYADAAERLKDSGMRVRRVVLDYELKRDYQRFLQAHNRGRRDASGRPDRTPDEIREWARQHHLPVTEEGRVQFPDVRIEYAHPDGRPDREDLELVTEHYNARQMAGKRSAGFGLVRGGRSRGRGATFDRRIAEKHLR